MDVFFPTLKSDILAEIKIQEFILSGAFNISSDDFLKFELPYVFFSRKAQTYFSDFLGVTYIYTIPEIKSNGVGNLYLGYEFKSNRRNSTIEFGVRFPLASEKKLAPLVGAIGDFDRMELYMPNVFSISALTRYRSPREKIFFNVIGGPTIMVRTKKEPYQDKTEILLSLSLRGGIIIQPLKIGVGYSGRFIVTEDGDLSDRIIHQIGVLVNISIGPSELGFYYRVPIDKNLKEIIKNVIGVNFAYVID
jgi:hypothetical protein